MPPALLLSRISQPAKMPSTRSAASARLVRASRADVNPVVQEVKRESSVSFDVSKPESTTSVKRKRVKRELEVNGEPPKKQVGIVPDIEDFRYDRTKAVTSSSKATLSSVKVEGKLRVSSVINGTHMPWCFSCYMFPFL